MNPFWMKAGIQIKYIIILKYQTNLCLEIFAINFFIKKNVGSKI